MKKFWKIVGWSLLSIVLLLITFMAGFVYKVKYGFPVSFETDVPSISFPDTQTRVLLFSKSTGYRHEESIEAGKRTFAELASRNNWFLYETEEGGVFNREQLLQFDAVIFNNSTGRVLNDEQQLALQEYVQQGGTLIGIHGSGDDSHHWDWYEQNLLGAQFSHHPLDPQLQEADVTRAELADSLLAKGLPLQWKHTDEWYVFFENPANKGFNILYSIDGERIQPSGNILWVKDKNFGMGKIHPVAWYRFNKKGSTFYTSMGHNASAWKQEAFVNMLENAVNRSGRSNQP